MRISRMLIPIALCAAATGAWAQSSITAANTQTSVIGSWTGAMFNGEFTFEFSNSDKGLIGRLKSNPNGKWLPLENVTFTNGTLLFDLNSQPRSSFSLKPDASGKFLVGNVIIGQEKDLPMPLRVERTAALP
ncbi:MAG: hypothetical protein K2W91_11455 [Novosphingobium sp.]|nr:hypothetical protein [Novosphingobium sp.]